MSMLDNDHLDTGLFEAAEDLATGSRDATAAGVVPNIVCPDQAGLNSSAGGHAGRTLRSAESYIRAGWKVCPGKRGHRDARDKEPVKGWSWTKQHLNVTEAPTYFANDQCNVLVVLGKSSGNLTDLDLDWPEATAAADVIFCSLPSFGRSGKPRSHRLTICDNVKPKKYQLPQSLATHPTVAKQQEHKMCIAEIRGSGGYTVFPESEHQTGQKVEWTDPQRDNIGAIPTLDAEELIKKMGLLAFAAFCMRFYPAVGARCDFMMAVAGALGHAAYDPTIVQQTVQSIGEFNSDPGDNGSWRVAADKVSSKIQSGKDVTGVPTLIKILGFGDDVLQWCRELLGASADNSVNLSTGAPAIPVHLNMVAPALAAPLVPKNDHMKRARLFRSLVRPHVLHYRDDYYDHERGHYKVVHDGTVKSAIYKFLDTCQRKVQLKLVPFQPNKLSVSETGEALKAVVHVLPTIEQPYWLDGRAGPEPTELICFSNGILDLSSNQFTPPDPMLFTPHGVGFDYDPKAGAPTEFLKFVNDVFAGEQDQIDALQEMFGYCLSSDVSQEKVFMMVGEKRSGKDTVRNTLQSLLSTTAVCGPTLESMSTNFGMSQLIGKQLAVVGDMRLGAKCDKDLLAEHILKLSGRGLFTLDRKYKSHWTGQLPCKLLLISNEIPKLKDNSGALPSRMITFLTRVSFYGREDPNLFRDKIKPELPAILLWSLDGLRRIRARGYIAEPACSIEARQQLARESSPILAFVQECLALDPTAIVNKNLLYATYLDYARDNNLPPTTKSWFFRDLETATAGKVKEERVRKDGASIYNIVGTKLSNSVSPVRQTTADVGEPSEADLYLDELIQKRAAA